MNDFEKNIIKEISDIKSEIISIALKDKESSGSGFLEKLTAVAPIIQGILIAIVGMVATILYNERQLDLSQLAALDKYRTYLSSDDSQERIFGYEAFLALGQEDFVIRLIAAKKDLAGEPILKSLVEKSADSATRQEATKRLEELRNEIEKQKSLGRNEMLNNELNNLIKYYPDDEKARLDRNTIEDWKYLVDRKSTISERPYFNLAKEYVANGKEEEAINLINLALDKFDIAIIELETKYINEEIDFATIRNSITLEALNKSWNQPPGLLYNNSLSLGRNRLVIWHNKISKESGLRVSFNRFGFQPIEIIFEKDQIVAKNILKKSVFIHKEDSTKRTMDIAGIVTLSGRNKHSGIQVTIADKFFNNRGFHKTYTTDNEGKFLLTDIPEGKFEIELIKSGYVPFGLPVELSGNNLQCYIDSKFHYNKTGVSNCDLEKNYIRLHPIKKLSINWTLQESYGKSNFRDTISEGEVELASALKYDWGRGGWSCCGAAYKFGALAIDHSYPDIVIYTDTDGKIYMAQPHSQFIASIGIKYEDLKDIPEDIIFLRKIEAIKGKTYILKTSAYAKNESNINRYFVKLVINNIR